MLRWAGTYRWQLGNDDCDGRQEVDAEVCKVVMGVVSADEKQADWHREEPLLCRRVLVTIVDLLPHVEIVIGAGVEVKRYAAHPVEHYVRASHVGDVCEGP